MKLSIDHLTHYQYEHPVRHSTQYLRLMPVSGPHQNVIEWKIEAPGTMRKTRDGFGNVLHVLTLEQPVFDIPIRSCGIVETTGAIDEVLDDHGLSPLLFLPNSSVVARARCPVCVNSPVPSGSACRFSPA